MIKIRIVGIDRDAEALAAEHEPDNAEFPILEPIEVGVGPVVKLNERTARDESLASALAGGDQERDVGDLLGERVDCAVNPDNLFVGAGEDRAVIFVFLASQPSSGAWGNRAPGSDLADDALDVVVRHGLLEMGGGEGGHGSGKD